jgi:hypothetical protein
MVEAFRGVGKSWITAAYVLWLLYKNPNERILVVSASKTRAEDFTTFVMQLIRDIPELRHLLPREDQRQSRIAFDVGPSGAHQSPSVRAAGITGQLAGSRASEIVADDIEIPNNSETTAMREKLAERVKEFDAILLPGGRVTYLGTPQTEESIYAHLPERGYTVRIWPARYPDPKRVEKYQGQLAEDIVADLARDPQLVGKPTEPSRFTDQDLREREISYGLAGFSLQFMLDTDLSDEERYPLKLKDLIVTNLDPRTAQEKYIWAASPEYEWKDLPNVGIGADRYFRPAPIRDPDFAPYQGVVLAVDPAGRGKDETGYAVVAALHGQLFLLDAGGLKGYETPTLEQLAKIAMKWKANTVIVEPNFGDGMFISLLKPVFAGIYPCTILESERSNAQKERRIIDTLEPVMSSHRLVVNAELVEDDFKSVNHYPSERAKLYRLFYQLTHITRDKGCLAHDDRVDALALAVGYWIQHLGLDVDKTVQKAKDKARDEQLRNFVKNCTFPLLGGRKPEKRRPMWATRS